MKSIEFTVDNLKCGGCASTIEKAIQSVDGIENIEISVETGGISFDAPDNNWELLKQKVLNKLKEKGYPESGTGNQWQKAKSFVSCAQGRLSI